MSGFNIKQAAIVGVSLLFGFVVGKGPDALKKENKAEEGGDVSIVDVYIKTSPYDSEYMSLKESTDLFKSISQLKNGFRGHNMGSEGGFAENIEVASFSIATETDTFLVVPRHDEKSGTGVVSNQQRREAEKSFK